MRTARNTTKKVTKTKRMKTKCPQESLPLAKVNFLLSRFAQ